MRRIVASAPGKVILSGEYAVLAGAPALSMAVDRRAVTTIDELPGTVSRLRTPGLTDGEWTFRKSASGELDWLDEVPATVASLLDAATGAFADRMPAVSISIDTRPFYNKESGRKFGLGSSAAAMTSTVQALCELSDQHCSVSDAAEAAHRRMQGGGSGVDVATSIHGGVIHYTNGDSSRTESRRWPSGLHCRVLWSGRPATTPDMVGRVVQDSWQTSSGKALVNAANDVARQWDGQPEQLLSAIQVYADCLLRFGVEREIGIYAAGHDTLFEMAKAADVVYKPSGAGGGDIGIVLALTENQVLAFSADAEVHGFSTLDLTLDPTGAQCREIADQ